MRGVLGLDGRVEAGLEGDDLGLLFAAVFGEGVRLCGELFVDAFGFRLCECQLLVERVDLELREKSATVRM